MVKKNSFLRHLLVFVFITLLSIIIEIFVYHFTFFTDNFKHNSYKLKNYVQYKDDDNNYIEFNLKNKYINKLVIDYTTKEDISYNIKYIEDDYYHNDKETIFTDVLNNELNSSIINFNNRVSKVIIEYPLSNQLKIKNIIVDNKFYFNYFRFIFYFLSMSLIYCFVCFYKDGFLSDKLHVYFFVISLIIGTNLVILQPSATYYSWDDEIHFYRVNELSSGNTTWNIGEHTMIDFTAIGRGSINSLEDQEQEIKYLNKHEKSSYSSYGGRFITYQQVVYIPSAIGFRFSRFLHIPFSISFKIGKWFNLLFYLLIVSYAIKISRIYKRLVTVIGMIPTSLFLASQYSYDAAVTSGILLSIVMITNWYVDKKFEMNFKNVLIFIIAMLYGCFSKAVYIPLILLFLVIPRDRFKNRLQGIMVKIGMVLIFVCMMATFVLPTVSSENISGDYRGGKTSVSDQLKLVIKHPTGYAKVLNDTMIEKFGNSFFGKGALANFSYIVSENAYNCYYMFLFIFLFVAFTDENRKFKVSYFQKICCCFTIFCVVLLIWTALYLSFTPVGLNTINGVQPRYFIPLLLPLLLCFSNTKIINNFSEKKYNFFVLLIPCFAMMFMIYKCVLLVYCM